MAQQGSLNRVQLIGRLGADPEARCTPTGMPVTRFAVATNASYKTAQGDERTETEWTRIVLWQQLAVICATYLQKGSRVYIEGRLRTSTWRDKQGVQRERTEVVATKVIFLDAGSRQVQTVLDDSTQEADADPIQFDEVGVTQAAQA